MFNKDFYPSKDTTIEKLVDGLVIKDKTILDPSAGSGAILNYCKLQDAAEVLACENHPQLRDIITGEGFKLIGEDFLKMESHQISHIDCIIMNPPFSADEQHIIHAFNIAPPGCHIHALCNFQTVDNPRYRGRKELVTIISNYGSYINLGNEFSTADRKTDIDIALVKIVKPGSNYNNEFEGFFTDEEPEEQSENGIIPYNAVRDLVNRYVASVKLFDEQLDLGIRMNTLTNGFMKPCSFICTVEDMPKTRNDFKKEMQKSGWKFIFSKMNMNKYSTKSLKEEMNKFVEQQTQIPFTMKNIYRMLDIVIQTAGQRMDKAMIEVFDKLTTHYADNRYNLEGWKTNSHYLVNQKFIMPWVMTRGYSDGEMECRYDGNVEILEDLTKALCFINGEDYNDKITLYNLTRYRYKLKDGDKYLREERYDLMLPIMESTIEKIMERKEQLYKKGIKSEMVDSQPTWGQWFDWEFFRCKAYKKGTMHFEFKDLDVWAKFNQHIARIKGYPLFEGKEQTAWQKRQNKQAA